MAQVSGEREGLVDGMPRDGRGYWQPDKEIGTPNPVFAWPPRPGAALKWLRGYLFPWNFIYMIVAVLTWLYLTPELARMKELRADWILEVFARNQVMLILFASAWHIYFWSRKAQGYRYKYTPEWMGKGKRKFLWNDQVRDNVFWSVVSGGSIWTAFEVFMLWAWANGLLPWVDPRAQPVHFVALLCLVPLWRVFHFYWSHRLLHVKALYRAAHYLHHKNINIGPWSGLSMHPVEHVLYFTCMLLHWVVASHPVHMIMNGQHAALSAVQGHLGFDEAVVSERVKVPVASYFHQLHHRYFECNYGEPDFPFDHWFGTSHDGSDEAHRQMRARQRAMHST